MIKFTLSIFCFASLVFPKVSLADHVNGSGVHVEKLLEAEKSWDGTQYQSYPEGTPQISVLKITFAPYTILKWHKHPMPNAGYVLCGTLTVEKKSSSKKLTVKAGDVLPEMVNGVHRGYTGKEGATLIVFYAGHKNLSLAE